MEEIIAYVILHYNTADDTFACVDSIRSFSNSPIVIICNGSKNDSDSIVSECYRESQGIKVIQSKTNLGYAKGNNIGIKYIRDNNIASIIVCLNNDTLIKDTQFEFVLKECYHSSQFAVGGGGCH